MKRRSMLAPAGLLADALFARAARAFGESGERDARTAYAFALDAAAVTPDHPSMAAYMSHPLRIASFCLDISPRPTARIVQTALLHNAYEVSGLDEAGLVQAGFGPEIAADVRLLTIDRARETDRAYLARFYGAIATRGPDLALLRCVDKLDNLLGAAAIGDAATHESYVDLAEEFVLPMAESIDRDFGAFFADVIACARREGPDPDFRRELDRFARGEAA